MTPHAWAVGDRSFRLWALVTLNVLDLFTTAAILSLGGSESNPAMAGFMVQWWWPIAVKAVVLALMWSVILRIHPRSKMASAALIGAWVFYAGVVGWNTLLLIRH